MGTRKGEGQAGLVATAPFAAIVRLDRLQAVASWTLSQGGEGEGDVLRHLSPLPNFS